MIAPTTDRAKVADAIDGIRLTRDTRVYDAVVAAVNLAGDEGARSVLLLTDGKDTGGGSTLDEAAAAAKDHEVAVNVVALDQSSANRALLARISHSSSGEVIKAADPASLRSVFTAEANALASQLLVRFTRPAGGPKDVDLDISLSAGGETYTDTAFVSLNRVAAGGPTTVKAAPALVGRHGHHARRRGSARASASRPSCLRAARFTRTDRVAEAGLGLPRRDRAQRRPDQPQGVCSRVHLERWSRATSRRGCPSGSRRRLTFTAAEWILLHAGIAVASARLGFVLGGGPFLVLAVCGGVVFPRCTSSSSVRGGSPPSLRSCRRR